MPRLALALLLALAACRAEAPPPAPPADAPAAPSAPSTPFDAAEAALDTVEPPEQVVRFPPRPAPPPPRPAPVPRPAPPPPGPAGSCDVRATEGYCFAFTGPGWTPAAAAARCGEAPDATFAPAACPREGRIATCAFVRPSAPDREIVYTYYAPYDPTLAELACPGTFVRLDQPGT